MDLVKLLRQYGQSVWLDGFERGWISHGWLQRYVDDGIGSIGSDFESLREAISGHEYDRDFNILSQRTINRTAKSDYENLVVRDLQLAADLLKPTYSQSQGRDGYVQVDLPPDVLVQAETAIAEAQKIWQMVGWRNLMLRIPATPAMLPVIETLIAHGININATLVFTQIRYEQVFYAYLKGLEILDQENESINEVACFASFPIFQWDSVLVPPLETISLGITQARMLYQHSQKLHHSDRWRVFKARANPLRLVWDCMGSQPDDIWRYIQFLEAPETSIVLSPSTLEKCSEIALLRPNNLQNTEQIMKQLVPLGIDLDQIIDQITNEAIAKSLKSFDQLLSAIDQKKMQLNQST